MEGSVSFNGPGFQAIRAKLDPVVREHMTECAELTARFAKKDSPVITGHNRRSVTVDIFKNGAVEKTIAEGEFSSPTNGPGPGIVAHSFRVATQSGYGGYLETGTAKTDPQPYIKPGFDKAVAELMRDLENSV